jgi:U3 small nucleolar ribonucleoprotein component
MIEKQTEILEYSHHQDGSVVIKKAVNILENGTVIASIVIREVVTDVNANADIPSEIKPHLKAISDHLKFKAAEKDSEKAAAKGAS